MQLGERGILSSRVLLFERDERRLPPGRSRTRERCLLTANTHDLPPLAALAGDAGPRSAPARRATFRTTTRLERARAEREERAPRP